VDIMGRPRHARLALVASVALWGGWASAAPPAPYDIEALMARVGAQVADYSRRARNVICVEHSTVQPIASNWSPDGMSRTVESELRVEFEADDGDALAEAKLIRHVRRVNGRAPRERDKKDRSGCTDPNPLSPEPLAFLLPSRRDDYRFTAVREGKEQDRAALIVDFTSANRTSKPELIEDERGHDDCFDWSGPVATRGRVWVDAATHDVLRVDRGLHGPVDVRVPWALQRRYNFSPWVVLERDDVTLRFQAVTFTNPDEVILLPESIVSVTMLRGGLQSIRRTEKFSDYRRFLTTSRVLR
jgi:hypothetical protein